jgi:hypothetical protein
MSKRAELGVMGLKLMTLIIDPPGGWRYGFPRPLTKEKDELLEDWLISAGYPAEDAEWAVGHCRYWNEKDEVISV